MNIEIQNKKIKLSNTKTSDIDKIVKIEKSNTKFIGSYTIKKHVQLLSDENCLHLSIISRMDQDLIGYMILFSLTVNEKALEIRRIAIDKKGFGYGRAAITLVKKICFEQLKFQRLWLDVYADNERAIQLYESEAFKFQGLLSIEHKNKKAHRSQKIYSFLKNEYDKM